MTYNASVYDNHLVLRKIGNKIKNCDFLCRAENCKSWILFPVRKMFQKMNNEYQIYNKTYLVRFIYSLRLMNASLDAHVNIFLSKIYNHDLNLHLIFKIVKKIVVAIYSWLLYIMSPTVFEYCQNILKTLSYC